jgi:hypothetical protein
MQTYQAMFADDIATAGHYRQTSTWGKVGTTRFREDEVRGRSMEKGRAVRPPLLGGYGAVGNKK